MLNASHCHRICSENDCQLIVSDLHHEIICRHFLCTPSVTTVLLELVPLMMAMSEEQRNTLDRCLVILVENLDVTDASVHLQSKGILNDADVDFIRAKPETREQIREFVRILKRKGETAYPLFRDYLLINANHIGTSLDGAFSLIEEEKHGVLVIIF